jgi:hypothetical protein
MRWIIEGRCDTRKDREDRNARYETQELSTDKFHDDLPGIKGERMTSALKRICRQ